MAVAAMNGDSDWVTDLVALLPNTAFVAKASNPPLFEQLTSLFNTAVESDAHLVVCPTTPQQVSTMLVFAQQRHLSISVKSGGFNTAGWSVKGNIIIDLSLMDKVDVHMPDAFTGTVEVKPLSENILGGETVGTDSDAERGTKRPYSASDSPRSSATDTTDTGEMRSGSRSDETGQTSRPSNSREGTSATRESDASVLEKKLDQVKSFHTRVERGEGRNDITEESPEQLHLPVRRRREAAAETRSWVVDQEANPTSVEPARAGPSAAILHPSDRPGLLRRLSGRDYSPPQYYEPDGTPSFAGAAVQNPTLLTSTSSSVPPPPSTESPPVFNPNRHHLSPLTSTTIFSTPSSDSETDESRSNPRSANSIVNSNSVINSPFALVTIGAGAKSRQIDAATAPFSYHVPLAAYPVGCAIFASGGFGFLSRLHGLSMDNVVEIEFVVPDGRILYLTAPKELAEGEEETEEEKEARDLWWGFRGAGLALGVVTKVRAKAYRVGLVFSGNLIYSFNPITAPSLMKHWRDCCKNVPRELYMNLILTAGPDPSSHVIVIQVCYVGDRSVGDQIVQNIMSWEGERCLLKDVETRTFLTQQESVVQVLSARAGHRWCIRADLVSSLPDECIYKTVAEFKNIPERSAWLFETAGGAIGDVAPDSSCFPTSHRSAPFQVAAIHQWRAAEDDDMWTYAARRWIDTIISPHSPGGSFPCFLESREGAQRIRSTFGDANWTKLEALKSKWDPNGLMKNCFWPSEEDGEFGRCKKASGKEKEV